MKVWYFGCMYEPGHYMWRRGGVHDWDFLESNPWHFDVDARLCPQGVVEIQGRALLHSKGGYTALAFWDRSADSRPRSNSVFIAEGAHTFAQMLALAHEHFPRVMDRFKFPIQLDGAQSEP